MPTKNIDLLSLIEHFSCEDKCHAFLEKLRWPNGAECPRCQEETTISRLDKRRQFECDSCGYQFSVRVGTVLQDSKLPLWKWFVTIFLLCQSKKGMSANQIKRTIGVSYKTAWFLCHRIRHAMSSLVENPLSGIVEVDETWVGGKAKSGSKAAKGKGRGYTGNKTMVVGAVERDGSIRLKVRSKADRKTLHAFIEKYAGEAARVYTDEHAGYVGIERADRAHKTVNHKAEEYVRGDVHTNSVENVWSLLKRSIIGAFHHVSVDHLPRYLDELEWRFNNRENPYLFRDTLVALMASDVMTYEKLVG
jgi:transposase-like protein